MKQLSARQYCQLLWLQSLGCPVDLECAGLLRKPKPQPLHICSRDGFLGADLDSKAGCTELSILLEIHVAAPIIVKRYWAYLSGFSQRACWLTPSQQSPDYYCVSPGYVLPSSLVLNQVLNPDHPLRRNDHLKGFLLGILNEPILDPEDERIGEGVLCLEDLSGEEFWFPIRVGSVGVPDQPEDPAPQVRRSGAIYASSG